MGGKKKAGKKGKKGKKEEKEPIDEYTEMRVEQLNSI
jgi:hypothetical protein